MNTYSISIAQSIRAYGFVTVEAETMEAAIAKVDTDYVVEHFQPHGHGEDDYDSSNPYDVCLTEIQESGEGDMDVEPEFSRELYLSLPNPKPGLDDLSTDEATLIVTALLALPANSMDAEAARTHDTLRFHLANTLLAQMQALAAVPVSDATLSEASAPIPEGAPA